MNDDDDNIYNDDDYEASNPQYAPGKLLLGNESYDDDSGNVDDGDIFYDVDKNKNDDDYLSLSVFCR